MKIYTKYFGEMEVQEKDIISFRGGIPGFKEHTRYALMHDADTDFSYLQSVDNEYLCFIMLPPAAIIGDYNIDISEECVEELEIGEPEDVSIYAILTIPEEVKDMTANLKAPVIINRRNGKGKQEILDDARYEIKHRIIKEADASC